MFSDTYILRQKDHSNFRWSNNQGQESNQRVPQNQQLRNLLFLEETLPQFMKITQATKKP